MRKIYRLEYEILQKPYGAQKRLADTIGISSKAVKNIFKTKKASCNTRAKYTDGFNLAFNENKNENYLFEIIEIKENGK